MNPATPGPLTVLLVPPIGDVALLAGECGGTVPVWTDYGKTAKHLYRDASDAWDWRPINMPSGGMMRALVLVHEGTPVAMGCDRALRLAIPAHYLRRHRALERREERARAIYAAYPGADAHPWVEGGSSGRQHDARYEAFNQMSEADQAALNSLGVIMGPAYQINEAIAIARLYADLFPGARVILLRDGREVTE